MTDGEEILGKQEAAEYIGVSPRQLIRLTNSGSVRRLDKKRESEPTRYARRELDRYLGKVLPVITGIVTPDTDGTPVTDGNSQALMRREVVTPVPLDTGDILDTPEMRARMLPAFEAMASPLRLADKLTLSLTEAALLSGLSRGHLREAIGEGKLKAKIIGRGWKLRRADLEKYIGTILR